MGTGNKPIDDGNYLFTPEQRTEFLRQEPAAEKWFRRWLGGDEFLNNVERWYLWLGDCSPSELRLLPESLKRVRAVQQFRSSSKSAPTRKLAETPTRFHTEFIPKSSFLAMPQVSSERRRFIPIDFLTPEFLCGDKLRVIENATLFHFGVLTSTMHMAWMRQVCGRLESRYQYSALIVYNNYPWPKLPKPPATADATRPTPAQAASQKKRAAIEAAAQAVLDARASFPEASLADLYDPLAMPPDLSKAHQQLDKAVDAAYAYKGQPDDASRVAFLFGLYEQMTSQVAQFNESRTHRRKQ